MITVPWLQVLDMLGNLVSLSDLPKVMAKIVPVLTGADRCSLLFWDKKEQAFVAGYTSGSTIPYSPDPTPLTLSPESVRRLSEVLRLKPHVVIEDLEHDDLLPVDLVKQFQARSMIIMPLVVADEVVGAMTLEYGRTAHHFDGREIACAASIASKVAATTRHAGVLQQDNHDTVIVKAVMKEMIDGIGLIDASGKTFYCNQRLAEIYGIAMDDIPGHPSSLVRDDLLSRVANPKDLVANLQKALSNLASSPTVEFQIVWPATRHIQLKLFPLQTESGEFVGRGTVVRDITSQKDLDHLKSDIMSVVSHQLREPLAAIKGCAATLLQSQWDHETLEGLVRIIGEQSGKIGELIDNLTDLSRIKAGVLRIERRPTDLAQVVRSAVNTIESRTRRHHLEILLPPGLPIAEVDAPRIEQVVVSLLENAVKYSPGGRNITVSVETDAEFVQISIADSGIGIPEEYLDRVFDRFFRVNSPEVAHVSGAGLGLAISRSLVEAHGGKIWAEIAPGRGSIFRFTLPSVLSLSPDARVSAGRTLPDQQRLMSDVPRPRPTEWGHSQDTKARILVADDEPRNVRFLRATLEAAGYNVIVVADGAVALETVSAQAPDLIFLDTLLPRINGYEVCRRVREFSDVPILMLGDRGGEADKVRGLNVGADDYLTKPFSTAELLARVRAAIRRATASVFSSAIASEHSSPTFACGNLKIDFIEHRVSLKGKEVKLTPIEYKVLYHLAVNAGRVLVHEDLLRRVWGPEYKSELGYLWVHIRHLRQKVEDNPGSPRYILTQPGFGYKLAGPS